jgi:peroxiredoxin
MKKVLHYFTSLIFCFATLPAWAQLPQKAEAICPMLVGESIPQINLVNFEGSTMNLQKLMNEKPTVLIFYRGGWCPFCNQHLSALGEASEEVIKMGYQIIAISPDEPAKLKQTAEKEKLPYQLSIIF